jgi:hypothetical protein
MATLLFILAGLAGIAMLVLFIMVLIKLFQEKGVLHGILGLICSLYTFIWGWMNADRLNIKNIMLYWSGAIVLYIIFYVAATALQ